MTLNNYFKQSILSIAVLSSFSANAACDIASGFCEQVALEGGSKTEVEFANYVESMVGADNELGDLLQAASATPGGAKALANELLATGDGAAVLSSLNTTFLTQKVIQNRIFTMRNQDRMGNFNFGWNTWVSLVGSNTSTDNDFGVDDVDSVSAGLMIGSDKYLVDDRSYLGYSVAYVHSNSQVDRSDKEVNIDKFQFSMYAGMAFENLYIDSLFNIGRSSASSERSIGDWSGFTGVTKSEADFNLLESGFKVVAGYHYETEYVNIKPSIAYNVQWISQDDYNEEGSDASLRYDRQDYQPTFIETSLDVYKDIDTDYGIVTPRLTVTYMDDRSNERIHENVQLALDNPNNPSFSALEGSKVGGDRMSLTSSVSLENENMWSVNALLGYETSDEMNSLFGTVNLTKRF